MTILVIGGTGQIGTEVVRHLCGRGAEVRVLSRNGPTGLEAPDVTVVTADMLDVDAMRIVLSAVDTVFLLLPPTPDELVRGLVLASLIQDTYVRSGRAVAKGAIEAAITSHGVPSTFLRVNALYQNDARIYADILAHHTYATPVGSIGMDLVDLRDVAEVAALETIRREDSTDALPNVTIDVVGPEVFTGGSMAALWSELLGDVVAYVGDDLASVERSMAASMPSGLAHDLINTFRGILDQGALGHSGAAAEVASLLGRPLRTYREFAATLHGVTD
jgi:uncharacterized protein YbjT (DUF2867 family)